MTTFEEFLSTPSARRATWASPDRSGSPPISIHALREEGDRLPCLGCGYKAISIHALREEGDRVHPAPVSRNDYFYPRPPRGGRHAA